MKQQRRYKEPQDTLWGKFLSGFMAVVFAMSTLTLIPIASAINGEPNEAQIQQQEELADQTSGKDEKADEPAADEQKLEPVELLSIASVEDEDDADDATPADVTLKVKAQNATVTYNGKDAATELVVPADKDVKFTVKAADGFTLGAAAVKLADAKGETTLTPNAGEYTVAADRVADGATIVVAAEAATGSANTDAAEPSTPAPSTELGEKMEMAKSVITSVFESVFGGTSTLAITGDDKVAVGKTITLTGNGGSNHKWSTSNKSVATISSGDWWGQNNTATVTGVSAGTVTITHTYIASLFGDTLTETFNVTVPEPSYYLYLYALIPGKDASQTGQADNNWFGLGVVTVKGVPDPATQSTGYAPDNYVIDYTDVKKGPIYPELPFDGVTYKYAASGTADSYKEGYYTLEPMRLRVAPGANAGNNGHNLTAETSTNTYHYDYTVVLNEKNVYTVNFKVQDPGFDTFAAVESAAQRVSSGTSESALTQPKMEDSKTVDGVIYQFDGWYTDEACTQKADFKGTVTANTNYYGKYVPVQHTITYTDGVDDEVVFEDQNISVAHGDATPTIADPTRTGYVFAGWDPEVAQTVSGDATYTATWKEDRNNNGVDDATEYRTVTYRDGANGAVFADNAITEVNGAKLLDGDATPTIADPTRTGYVFAGWDPEVAQTVSGDATYTATWALDVIGTDPTDPGNNAPDGIADKYQLVVTYAAIAGTIDGPARYVLNKYDAAGNLAEDGVAVLTAAQIPGTTADDGYGNGVWNNEPLANMELTDDTAFVIAFTALPAAAVVVPPLAPVAAAAPAAAAAAAATTILDDGVPLATIDDDENALAAFEEIHCWTHWLMIFGALVTIVYGLAVLYRRRHGIRDMDDFEGDIMGGRKYDAAAEKSPAAGNAFQAM